MLREMNWKVTFFFFVSTVLLFLGFDRNQWRLSPAESFSSFQQDSESLILGRLVESRQNGILSNGALLGWGDAASQETISNSDYDHQYEIYLSDGEFNSYLVYKSQSGMQGLFFSALDSVSSFSSSRNLRLFRAFTAFLSALTISALVTWFLLEFGWLTGAIVLVSTLVSMWVTFYARNLFYDLWTYFLPMVAVLYLLRRESQGIPLKERTLNLTIFGLIFFKGLFTGYDFLLPPLGMIATALIFYALKDRWTFSRAARRLFLAAGLSISGVLLSFLVVAAQVGAVTGHFSDGLVHLANTIGRRTIGETLDPAQSGVFATAGAAGLGYVLNVLMSKSAIMVGIKYSHLILFFAGISILCLAWVLTKKGKDAVSSLALLGATWISILSPLSWVVAFKAHAFFHTHTTSIIWHMPFAFFGYAVLGHLLSLLIGRRDRLA